MQKKLISIVLSLILVLSLAACGADKTPSDNTVEDPSSSEESSSTVPEPPKVEYALNTLTGETNLAKEAEGTKPIAITVNNIRVAQAVQCGIHKADVVFETEVEGGITRLLALFADPTNVEKIGSVRSLRVVFVDLAAGMNALVVHHGIDPTYCVPYLASSNVVSHQIGSKVDGYREKNGLASEHTLFTNGKLLDGVLSAKGKDKGGNKTAWLNFRDTDEKVAASEQAASKLSVTFSGSVTTQFIYDAEAKRYARARKGVEYKDAASGERELFTNVFVLKTTITPYPNNVHKKVYLESGSGYYATAGTIVPIKWQKGASNNNFKFTLEDGTPLTVNQGNSYVCIAGNSQPFTFE